jgi:hypothetical protein
MQKLLFVLFLSVLSACSSTQIATTEGKARTPASQKALIDCYSPQLRVMIDYSIPRARLSILRSERNSREDYIGSGSHFINDVGSVTAFDFHFEGRTLVKYNVTSRRPMILDGQQNNEDWRCAVRVE